MIERLRQLVQVDVGNRGLANLFPECADDLRSACQSIATTPSARLLVVTGFPIIGQDPVCGETDGPLGALFLARAMTSLGIPVTLLAEPIYMHDLRLGLEFLRIDETVSVCETVDKVQQPTHVIAIERVGPSATGAYYSMRGVEITKWVQPVDELFEKGVSWRTIGIGDGGNEIGMGKLPRHVIRDNIPNGDTIACRTATDDLIVAGVSNWGAYALAAGVMWERGAWTPSLFDVDAERSLLEHLVEQGSLIDGVTGEASATVDGLTWETYSQVLTEIGQLSDRAGQPT